MYLVQMKSRLLFYNVLFSKKDQVPSSTFGNFKTERKGQVKKNVDLIDIINELQNKLVASGHTLDINLPQIIVVGSQSAGKSSVLEGFVGREFLPRGRDTVTRRPTYVQMFPNPQEEYVIFDHMPNVKFTDFIKVRDEIKSETLKNPGPTGFTSEPISLKIYSPRVLKLTVVDLPGLIKIVEDGQEQVSIQEVRSMILKYISPEESLILAVTPATQDIVTSDALEIAKEVDPKRERTIGVLTKLDGLSDGTDCRDVLENRKIYLSKGYVGVINRNQKEIDDGKDFQYILQKEKDFFANHPAYCHMKDVSGAPYLTRMLQKALRTHIKKYLPQLRGEVSKKLSEHQKELRNFKKRMGDSIAVNETCGKQFYVIKLIQNFIEDIYVQIMGNSELVNMDKFSAGAVINYIFATEVSKNLKLNLTPDENRSTFMIANMFGFRTSISIPTMALDALNRELLENYKIPLEESVKRIKEVLDTAITESAEKICRFDSLKGEILFLIRQCIDKEAEKTTDLLFAHVDAHMFYINFNYPNFESTECDPVVPPAGPIKLWENTSATDLQVNEVPETQMLNLMKQNKNNQMYVKYAVTLLIKNLEYVQKQMEDVAIKYIAFFLIKKVLDFIKVELLPTLLESSNFASLIEDCEADFRWKEETEAMCKLLKETLETIRDF